MSRRTQTMIDFWNRAVRIKLGVGDDWVWCRLEAVGPDTLVTGGVPVKIARGPNKGKKRWPKGTTQQCVVTRAELRHVQGCYERDTGNCSACCGDGKDLERAYKDADGSWRHGTRDCDRCKGSGKAPTGAVL